MGRLEEGPVPQLPDGREVDGEPHDAHGRKARAPALAERWHFSGGAGGAVLHLLYSPIMTQRADVLILEDNPTELDELATVTEGSGLETMATRSPAQAIRLLRANDPTLAIIDWNMELSPEGERTAESVLRALARDHPDTYTIVYATNAGTDMRLQDRIAAAHPWAITHDKRAGLDSLLRRVRTMLQRKVGDLRIDRGSVVHLPSGLRYKNKWAVRLLCGHPGAVKVRRNSAQYYAIYRFGHWLIEVGSDASVVAERGGGFYRLDISHTSAAARASQRD